MNHHIIKAWVCERSKAGFEGKSITYRDLFLRMHPEWHDDLLDVLATLWVEGYIDLCRGNKVKILHEPFEPSKMEKRGYMKMILGHAGDTFQGSTKVDDYKA